MKPNEYGACDFKIKANDKATKQLLEEIYRSSEVDDELVDLAIIHPNERVPIALIASWGRKIDQKTRLRLYERAVRTCEAENIAWHPLFDAMTIHDCWPTPDEQPPGMLIVRIPDDATLEKQIEPILAWIKTAEDPEEIRMLLRFKAYRILKLVGRHLGKVTEEFMRLFPMPGLAGNPRLPDDRAENYAHQAADLLMTTSRFPIVVQRYNVSKEIYAIDTLRELSKAGRRIPGVVIDRLAEAAANNPKSFFYAQALAEIGAQVSTAQLKKAFNPAATTMTLRFLINHPSATPAYQRYVLEQISKTNSQENLDSLHLDLSRNMRSLADPMLRKMILRTTSLYVLDEALATAANADDDLFLTIFRRFVECAPEFAPGEIFDPPAAVAETDQWRKRVRQHHLSELVDAVIRSNNVGALKSLLFYPETADNPRVWDALLSHPEAMVDSTLRHLALHATGERFRRVFALLTQKFPPGSVIRSLEFFMNEQPAGLAALQTVDLVPLLKSEDPKIRTQAIVLLSRLQKPTLGPTIPACPSQTNKPKRQG